MTAKIIYHRIFVWGILLLLNMGLQAQPLVFPVRVNTQVIVGGSVYLGDFANPMATADRLRYTLILQDPVEQERTVYFRVTIAQNGTVIASNPPGFRGNLVTLQRNIPLVINGEDLALNLSINNLSGLSGQNAFGVLNEGITDICIEVIDAFREEPISDRVCATGFLARLQAPILILPIEGQNIFENQLNNMVFTWQMTDPLAHLPMVNINYLFELREKSPFLDPQDQFENHTLIFSTVVDNFALFYNELSSQLDPGSVYIWRVTARFFDEGGNQIPEYFVNNGISRIGLFQVLPEITINPSESGVSCFCPDDECGVFFPDLTDLVPSLSVGDSVKYGAFYVKINSLSGSGMSGSGSVHVPFLNLSLQVSFENLQINNRYVVTSGNLFSMASSLVQGIGVLPEGLPDVQSIVNSSWLSSVQAHVNQIQEMFTLPVSLGNNLAMLGFQMPFDIYVTSFNFNIFGSASMNLIMVIPGANGQFYNFGISEVRVGRNGLDLADLKMFLLNDVTLPGLSNVPVLLKKAVLEDFSAGSFIAFDCSGLELFNLQATYTFPQDHVIPAGGAEGPLEASFTLQSTQWGQFMGIGSIPSFEVSAAPEWVFTADGIYIDLDVSRNPEDIVFPENYAFTGVDWRGFYMRELSVQFPESISLHSGSEPIVFGTRDLIIDSRGLSCSSSASGLLDISTGSAGGWGISIDSIILRILESSFVDAQIIGGIQIGIIDANVDYNGLVFKDINNNYSFNLSPFGSFSIPFLKLTADIETGSMLGLQRPTGGGSYRPFADFNINISIQAPEEDFYNSGIGAILDELKGLLDLVGFDFSLSSLKLRGFKINHPDLPPGRWFGLDGIEGGEIQIPGLGGLSLGDFMLLEQETDFGGVSMPGLGLDMQMNFGLAGIGLGIWAKQDSGGDSGSGSSGSGSSGGSGGSAFPSFSFGKFVLRLPDFSGMSFRCECEGEDATGQLGEVNYCEDPVLTGGTLSSLSPDDRFKAGHFTVRVDEVTGPGAGTGKVEMPFLNILLDVSFNNLIIHEMPDGDKRLISGYVHSAPGSLLNGLSIPVPDIPGPIDLSSLPVTEAFMSEIQNLASQAGQFFSLPMSLREKMQTLFGVTLPEGFDFILLGMRWGPTKAGLSAMLTVKLPGNNYLKFGLAGMRIRPDGFNMDGIQIYLAEDFTPDF